MTRHMDAVSLTAADARLHASIRKAYHQGVPVADLARAAGVERSTIYRWEWPCRTYIYAGGGA